MYFRAKNKIGDALNLSLFPRILDRTNMWSNRSNKELIKDSRLKTPVIEGGVISGEKF
jgi:hypothetical protein